MELKSSYPGNVLGREYMLFDVEVVDLCLDGTVFVEL